MHTVRVDAVASGREQARRDHLRGQDLELGQQDGGLQGVEAAIHAHANVVVAAILPMTGDLPKGLSLFIVIGEDCTAIAIAAKRFAREETGASNGAQVAGALAFISCTEALCSVLDDRDVEFVREREDLLPRGSGLAAAELGQRERDPERDHGHEL